MLLINKKIMSELRKRTGLSVPAIYYRITRIQEKYLVKKEDAANFVAFEEGVPVHEILSEPELARLRELRRTVSAPPKGEVTRKVTKEKPVSKEVVEREPTISPNMLYDLLQFHPRIVKASRSHFRSREYGDAIFAAFRCIEVLVKEKSGVKNKNGQSLMSTVFNEKHPIIKLNRLERDFEKDEQMGFMFIYMGAMTGIRNPKAHAEIEQEDPYRTLEYLSLASLLAKRVEEGEKVGG